jgi:hypothetical protein
MVAEVVLGPLLATLFLIPLLLAAAIGIGLSVVATLADSSQSLSGRLEAVRPQLMLVLWAACAAVGVSALWAAILRREEHAYDSRLRFILFAGILLGEIAALGWLWVMTRQEPGYGTYTWAVWLALLLGPMIVGARYMIALVRQQRSDDT